MTKNYRFISDLGVSDRKEKTVGQIKCRMNFFPEQVFFPFDPKRLKAGYFSSDPKMLAQTNCLIPDDEFSLKNYASSTPSLKL